MTETATVAGKIAPHVVDADGHVLEPANLWLDYLEERYRERAIRLELNADGLEIVMVDNRPFDRLSPGGIALIGSMGEEDAVPGPDRRYMDSMPLGACDPVDRIAHCDKEGLDGVVLYPTLGLVWPSVVEDAELADAYARAYNRWLVDFCRDSNGRLVPVAQLSLNDPELAARELRRAVADGCRAGFVLPFTWNRVPHGDPAYDPLWAAAQELGVPVGIHPGYEPRFANTLARFTNMDSSPGIGDAGAQFMSNMAARIGVQEAFSSFFAYATLERFPQLRVGVLESGAGWIGSFLDRMDALVGETIFRRFVSLSLAPSEYFRRQCFISCDPDETAAPLTIDHVGSHCFLWATDYPHPDHPADWQRSLQRLVEPLSAETTAKLAGGNAISLYGVGKAA
jgi:predicted TIM-barrel fold metal-dependent hydrolase